MARTPARAARTPARMWGMVDAVARFECGGSHPAVGYGLFEYWALGEHKPTGLTP